MSATHPIKIVVDRTQATRDLAALQAQLNGLNTAANNAGRGLNGANDNSKKLSQTLLNATGNSKQFGAALTAVKFVALGLGAGLLAVGVAAARTTAKFQTLKASLQVATGSMAKASQEFQRLQKFAAATPFTTEQAVQGFIKLKNLGLDPSERAMKSYGNTAASLGKTMQDMVEAVADASTGEFERLKEFGIKSQTVGDKVKFTFAGVTTAVGKNSADIQKYLIKLGETKFAGSMDLQSKTLVGVMSTLSDTMDNLLNKIGEGFADSLFAAANGLSSGAQSMEAMAVSAGKLAGTALSMLIKGLAFVADNARLLGGVLVILASRTVTTLVVGAFTAMGAVLRQVQTAIVATRIAAALAGTTMTTMGVAATGARAAMLGLSAAMGGPLGIALTAIAAAFYLLMTREDAATKATKALHNETKTLNDTLADQSSSAMAIEASEGRTRASIAEAKAKLEVLKAEKSLAINRIRFSLIDENGSWHPERMDTKLDRQMSDIQTEIDNAEQALFHMDLGKGLPTIGQIGARAQAALASGGGSASSGTASGEKMLSPQRAIQLLTSDLANRGLLVSENKYTSNQALPGEHAMRDHNTRAVDVNVAGGGQNEKLRLDAEALRLQKLGFTVLWNGSVYAGGGDGPTGKISHKGPGDWMHKTHLHAQADKSIAASGLDPSSIADATADKYAAAQEKYNDALVDSNKQASDYLKTQLGITDTTKMSVIAQRVFAEQQEAITGYGKEFYALSKDQQQVLLDNAEIRAREKGEAEALAGIQERTKGREQELLDLKTQIAEKMIGQTKEGQAQLEAMKVLKAEEAERLKIIEAGGDPMAEYAKNAIAAAGAAEREALARNAMLAGFDKAADAKKNIADRNLAKLSPLDREGAEYQRQLNDENLRHESAMKAALNEDEKKQEIANHEIIMRDYVEAHQSAIALISNEFYSKLSSGISQLGNSLAQLIGGKTGKKIGGALDGLSGLVGMFSKGADGKISFGDPKAWTGEGQSGVGGAIGGLKGITDSLGSIFGTGSKAGTFFGGLSKALGTAGIGAQVGAAIAPIGKLFSKKFSTTGSEIGGAIGSLVGGPIGAVIGSIGGGIIGGLLKKKPAPGKATIGFDQYGNLRAPVSGGKGDNGKKAAGIAGNIVSGVSGLAQALGGFVDPSSNFTIAVKVKGDKIWIKPKISGKEGKKFSDEGAATAYAIQQALKAGAIAGISDFSKRILTNAKTADFESAVSLATSYEKILDELDAMKNPNTAGLTQFVKDMDRLTASLQKAGATTEELAKASEYRELKLKQILDNTLDSLNQFKKSLSGEGSGVTALNRLNKDLADFQSMKNDIAAGKSVDQEKFTDLGSEIFGLAGDVYGTSTSAFQAIRAMLMDATDGAIENATKAYNEAVLAAMATQTAATEVTNSHLEDIKKLIERLNESGGFFANIAARGLAAKNGLSEGTY